MLGAANAALWRGPVWLNERVTITSMPSSRPLIMPSCSCASLLSAYGLAGATGLSSVSGAVEGAYTVAEPGITTRHRDPARRSASRSRCVARTLLDSGVTVSRHECATLGAPAQW